jgi:ATP-dependent Lhr-like helicase
VPDRGTRARSGAASRGGARPDPSEAIHDEFTSGRAPAFRPVTIADTSAKKKLELQIEVPVEDMARLGETDDIPSGPASQGGPRSSIWTAIHPRLLELVRAHRSTLVFVNSRRIAERLASAINELAGDVLIRAIMAPSRARNGSRSKTA